jgi:hypothetical protein
MGIPREAHPRRLPKYGKIWGVFVLKKEHCSLYFTVLYYTVSR